MDKDDNKTYCQFFTSFAILSLSPNLLDIRIMKCLQMKWYNIWDWFQNNKGGKRWKKDWSWTDGCWWLHGNSWYCPDFGILETFHNKKLKRKKCVKWVSSSKLRTNFPTVEKQQAVVNWVCKLAKMLTVIMYLFLLFCGEGKALKFVFQKVDSGSKLKKDQGKNTAIKKAYWLELKKNKKQDMQSNSFRFFSLQRDGTGVCQGQRERHSSNQASA